ncbi:MAG: SPOR domain-containing protein [Proteobacteria bacterium]|nr:SPOR domain-containing protein [Pseudomonadota bacterium]
MASKNRRMFELRLGKPGLILFICGMSLLLFSMFLLGIVVGKHMDAYPERYSLGIPEMIRGRLLGSAPKAETVSPQSMKEGEKNEPDGGEEKFGLTFFDTLGGKKGGTPAGIQAGAEKNRPPGTSATPAGPAESPAMSGASTSTPGIASGKTAVPAPGGEEVGKKQGPPAEGAPAAETVVKKSVTPPAEPQPEEEAAQGKGRYEIQAGAYRERKKAEQLVQKISSPGFSARVVTKELPGKGRWFRVIVGGFESRAKAHEAADKLAGKISGLKCVIRPSGRNGSGD